MQSKTKTRKTPSQRNYAMIYFASSLTPWYRVKNELEGATTEKIWHKVLKTTKVQVHPLLKSTLSDIRSVTWEFMPDLPDTTVWSYVLLLLFSSY
jgi:hypothetical protein